MDKTKELQVRTALETLSEATFDISGNLRLMSKLDMDVIESLISDVIQACEESVNALKRVEDTIGMSRFRLYQDVVFRDDEGPYEADKARYSIVKIDYDEAALVIEPENGRAKQLTTQARLSEPWRKLRHYNPNAMPPGLCSDGQQVYNLVMGVAGELGLTQTGGCTTFYSPGQWKARGEHSCTDALLIVVYDGGDFAYLFQEGAEDDGYAAAQMSEALERSGFHAQAGSSWYSGIYAIAPF